MVTELPCPYPMARAEGCPFDPPPALRERGSISRVRIWDGTTPWLLTRYDDQRAALVNPALSADSRKDGYPSDSAALSARRREVRTFIAMDNPEHDIYRRMLIKDFMPRRVEQLRSRVQDLVDGLIDDLLAGPQPANLVGRFGLPVSSAVICDLLGVPHEDKPFFQACAARLLIRDDSDVADAMAANRELDRYLVELVDRKAAGPQDDIVSRLVVDQVRPGLMSRTEAANLVNLVLLAGFETTANMISLGTLALLDNRAKFAELGSTTDPAVLADAVEELLRYLTITHNGLRRVATEDIEIAGTKISAGEGVILATDLGNRDAEFFSEHADQLDIHRRMRHHLAFGFGVHQCLGQSLARLELRIVFGTLCRRIPSLRLAVPISDLQFKSSMMVYGVHELPVSW
jgi:cytochrome P450